MQMPRYISLELESPIYNQHQRNKFIKKKIPKIKKSSTQFQENHKKKHKHTYMTSFACVSHIIQYIDVAT